MSFEFYRFSYPSLDEIINAYGRFEPDFVTKAYLYWFPSFVRKAIFYYDVQRLNVESVVSRRFQSAYGIPDECDAYEYAFEHGFPDVWDIFAKEQGLTDYESQVQSAVADLERMYNDLGLNDRFPVVTRSRLLSEFVEGLSKFTYRGLKHSLDAYWFDREIHNDSDQIRALRSMPYPEYLKSDHWRHVRTCMLMIGRAHCQSQRCAGADGYWFDEKYLHVHHVSYKNRGNERYYDLVLLCDGCHKLTHEGNPSIVSEYLDNFRTAHYSFLGRES